MDSSPLTFHIRHAFLLPLGLLVLLTSGLFVLGLVQHQPPAKLLLLGAIWLPVTILFIESLFRRTEIDAEIVRVHKLLRTSSLRFADVASLDAMQVRKRAFLTLSSTKHCLIFSNAYQDFPELVRTLLKRVPAGTVTDGCRQLAADPPVKSSDIVSCWLAVALVALVLYFQVIR